MIYLLRIEPLGVVTHWEGQVPQPGDEIDCDTKTVAPSSGPELPGFNNSPAKFVATRLRGRVTKRVWTAPGCATLTLTVSR